MRKMNDRTLPFSIRVQIKSRLLMIVAYNLESAIQVSEDQMYRRE